MSDSYLRIIPSDPTFVPARAYQSQLKRLFQSLVGKDDGVVALVSEKVEFVDAGENLESVFCPVCETSLDLDWWTEQVDNAYAKDHFATLEVALPCCGRHLSLNNLRYDWPVGWAKFVLEAHNPVDDITDDQLDIMTRVCGKPLKVIRACY